MAQNKSNVTVVKSEARKEVRFDEVENGSFFLKGKQLYIKIDGGRKSAYYNSQKIPAPVNYHNNIDFNDNEMVEVVNIEVTIL